MSAATWRQPQHGGHSYIYVSDNILDMAAKIKISPEQRSRYQMVMGTNTAHTFITRAKKTLATLECKWNLKRIAPLVGTTALVVSATSYMKSDRRREVVVKIPLRKDDGIAQVTFMQGCRAVSPEIIASDTQTGAYMMEKCEPATDVSPGDIDRVIDYITQRSTAWATGMLSTQAGLVMDITTNIEHGLSGANLHRMCMECGLGGVALNDNAVLLHGAVTPSHVLRNGKGDVVLISPRAVRGDVCWDYATAAATIPFEGVSYKQLIEKFSVSKRGSTRTKKKMFTWLSLIALVNPYSAPDYYRTYLINYATRGCWPYLRQLINSCSTLPEIQENLIGKVDVWL